MFSRWVAPKRQQPYLSLRSHLLMVEGGAIYSQQATRPDMTKMTLGQWPTDTCHNGRISNTHGSFTWATSKANWTNSERDLLSFSSLEDIGLGWASHQRLTSITSTPLNSSVVPMTQERRSKTTKRLRLLRFNIFRRLCTHTTNGFGHHQCLRTFLGVIFDG